MTEKKKETIEIKNPVKDELKRKKYESKLKNEIINYSSISKDKDDYILYKSKLEPKRPRAENLDGFELVESGVYPKSLGKVIERLLKENHYSSICHQRVYVETTQGSNLFDVYVSYEFNPALLKHPDIKNKKELK